MPCDAAFSRISRRSAAKSLNSFGNGAAACYLIVTFFHLCLFSCVILIAIALLKCVFYSLNVKTMWNPRLEPDQASSLWDYKALLHLYYYYQ